MTHTNELTHEVIRKNYHNAPRLGEDENAYGKGPRYCPSIDKKLWMFPDKKVHNVWLEPEGIE